MAVEFKTVEAIDSLVALLRVAENSAVHCWEQEEPFDPGIFPGLILLARFAAERAGTEYRLALEVAEKNRRSYAERDITNEQLAQVAAERDAERERVVTLRRECEEEKDRLQKDHELSAAQGFPASYVFCGSKSAVTRQIGNSVAPPVAAAITRAIAGAA